MTVLHDTPDDTPGHPDAATRVAVQPHPVDERCYDCATDEELEAAFSKRPHPTIHFGDGTGSPPVPCPFSPPDGETTGQAVTR